MGFHRAVLFVGAVLAALLLPVAASTAAPSVLTARTESGHDTLWLVSPAGGEPTAAGALPGFAGSAAVSPDGASVAYLPEYGAPFVWIGYGTLTPKTISLKPAGLKTTMSMTWIDADRLLVSGTTKTRYRDVRAARLFVVDVHTGVAKPFRGLRGAEPSADVSSGKVAYVQFTKLDNGSASNNHAPLYRESLRLLSVNGSGAGRSLRSEQYRLYLDYRVFGEPQLAPGGRWLIYYSAGSEGSVVSHLCDIDSMGLREWMTVWSAWGLPSAAWEPGGTRVAFAVQAPSAGDSTSSEGHVLVYNVATGTLTRTPAGVAEGVLHVAWSSDGVLALDTYDYTTDSEHVLAMRGDDLSTAQDIGDGHLSVWVP